MNLLKNPTIEELQTLLSACDDNECHHKEGDTKASI